MLFDSHAHLHLTQFDNDREEIIKKLRDFDIKAIDVGTDLEDSKKAVDLAKKYPDLLWASVGLHPIDASDNFYFNGFEELAVDEKAVAIGECGLDYYKMEDNEIKIKSEKQKKVFIKQIEIAKELKKPLIIHARAKKEDDAYIDVLEIIKSFGLNFSSGNGVAHFFAGSKETARQFLDLGFYISFAGPITFASEYQEIAEFVPIEKTLIETDSPFAAPLPWRGRRNEPIFVEFVARKIAEWKGLEFKQVAIQTAENAKKLFRIN